MIVRYFESVLLMRTQLFVVNIIVRMTPDPFLVKIAFFLGKRQDNYDIWKV